MLLQAASELNAVFNEDLWVIVSKSFDSVSYRAWIATSHHHSAHVIYWRIIAFFSRWVVITRLLLKLLFKYYLTEILIIALDVDMIDPTAYLELPELLAVHSNYYCRKPVSPKYQEENIVEQ